MFLSPKRYRTCRGAILVNRCCFRLDGLWYALEYSGATPIKCVPYTRAYVCRPFLVLKCHESRFSCMGCFSVARSHFYFFAVLVGWG